MVRASKYLTQEEKDRVMELFHSLDDNRDSTIAKLLGYTTTRVGQVIQIENNYKYKFWPTRRRFNRNYSK